MTAPDEYILDPIQQYIQEQPYDMVCLQGGPLHNLKFVIPTGLEETLDLFFQDEPTGNTFTVTYKQKRIYDFGTWEYAFIGMVLYEEKV